VARFETYGKQVCAMVVMDGKDARNYFNEVVRLAQADVTPQQAEELFDTFRARKIER
jgi:hypothetical protein